MQKGPQPLGCGLLQTILVLAFYDDLTVGFDGDGHAVLDIIQECFTQTVHNRHIHTFQPHGGQNGTGCCQRVNVVGKQHTGGDPLHGAGCVQNQTAGGGADGLGQAQSLAQHFLAEEILEYYFDLVFASDVYTYENQVG